MSKTEILEQLPKLRPEELAEKHPDEGSSSEDVQARILAKLRA